MWLNNRMARGAAYQSCAWLLLSFIILLFIPSRALAQTNPCQIPSNIRTASFNVVTTTALNTIIAAPAVPSPLAPVTSRIYICAFTINLVGLATANTITISYGTGTNCATTNTAIATFVGSVVVGSTTVILWDTPIPILLLNQVCYVTTQAAEVTGLISYVYY
jgi:hypothetical protein